MAFVGSGLGAVSPVSNAKLGISARPMASASSTLPARKSRIISPHSAAHQWVATPISPTAPIDNSGSVSASSPL